MIDTGSSVSGITSAIAASLGLTGLGKRPLKSAQGEGQIERFAFRVGLRDPKHSDTLPAFPFVFDEVIGIDLRAAFEFQALIGMDILSQCDLNLSRTGRCRLEFGT